MIYDIGNVIIDYSLPVTYPKEIVFKHGYFGPEYQFNDLEHKAALIFTAILNYEAGNGNCNICDVVEKSKYINLIRSILKRNGIKAIFVDEDVDDLDNICIIEGNDLLDFIKCITMSDIKMLSFLLSDSSYIQKGDFQYVDSNQTWDF